MRISATEFVISDVLAPALDRLWVMGADFPVHLQSQADVVSLAGRDADLAIRMVRPEGLARRRQAINVCTASITMSCCASVMSGKRGSESACA